MTAPTFRHDRFATTHATNGVPKNDAPSAAMPEPPKRAMRCAQTTPLKPFRVIKKSATGKAVLQIAKKKRDRRTAARMCRSKQAPQFLSEMRAKFYGTLVEPSLETVRRAVSGLPLEGRDPQLAYRILMNAGVVPSASERFHEMTEEVSDQRSQIDRIDNEIDLQIAKMLREKHEAFGTTFPEIDGGRLLKPRPKEVDDTVPDLADRPARFESDVDD